MIADPNAPVRVYRSLKGTPEQIFDAWLTPKKIAYWMTAPNGDKSVKMTTDGIPGTHFSFTVQRNGADLNHVGEYLEIRRPHRLVFTWGVEGLPMGASRVAIDFEANGAETFVTLTHRGVDGEYKERTQAGWEKTVAAVEESLTIKK